MNPQSHAQVTTISLPAVSGTSTTVSLPANHYIMAGKPFDRPAYLSASGSAFYTYSSSTGYATVAGAVTLQPGQGAGVFSVSGCMLALTSM